MRTVYVWLFVLTVGLMSLFYIQRQAEHDFQSHWHYSPVATSDFTFSRARVFGDETIPYHLTPKKQKKEETNYFWSYCYYGGK